MNYVYIVLCNDNTLYTGWTNALLARIEAHNNNRGAKYTRGRGPVRLVYIEVFEEKKDALKREIAIKKLSRKKKLELIKALFSPQSKNSSDHSCNDCSNYIECKKQSKKMPKAPL